MTQKMKLLIGYDGSDGATAALDDLQRAGLPDDAEALVITVAEVWLPPPSFQEIVNEEDELPKLPEVEKAHRKGEAILQESRALAELGAKRLHTNFPQWKVGAEALSGSPAWELILKADQWQPDLIVVGSHGQSNFSNLMLGSVSQRVVTEARCSVRVARGRVDEPETPVRIVVGVDGSSQSELAVASVASRVWPTGSEIRLIVADDPFGAFTPPLAEATDETPPTARTWIDEILERSAALLRGTRLKITTEVREGDPKKVLIEVAEEWGADSIFTGSTGFSNSLERFVLGSVASAVVVRAHCSVEVVRKNSPPAE
jgi:nucleotide-binding universal stress UspA family protein